LVKGAVIGKAQVASDPANCAFHQRILRAKSKFDRQVRFGRAGSLPRSPHCLRVA
jgi:hypothetical protein